MSDSIDITDDDDDLFHHQLLVSKGHAPPSIAADFDIINGGYGWGRSDNPEIISRSVPGKCVFVPVEARELTISSLNFPETQFPYSTSSVDYYNLSRFEVVEVNSVESLDIRARIKTRLLSPKTIYGAYLLFIIISTDKFEGLGSAKAMVRFVDAETEGDAEGRADIVHLQVVVDEKQGKMAVERGDGWMEIQIGNFYVDYECDDEQVEARLIKTSCCKMGLVVVGVEFRPLACVKQV